MGNRTDFTLTPAGLETGEHALKFVQSNALKGGLFVADAFDNYAAHFDREALKGLRDFLVDFLKVELPTKPHAVIRAVLKRDGEVQVLSRVDDDDLPWKSILDGYFSDSDIESFEVLFEGVGSDE